MSFSIIILAAGKGTRMNSKIPKVFHKVGNLPMIFHVLNVSKLLKPKTIAIVISNEILKYKNQIKKKYKNIKFVIQSQQLGTADAVKSALYEESLINSKVTLILYGDTPLISYKSLKNVLKDLKKPMQIFVYCLCLHLIITILMGDY